MVAHLVSDLLYVTALAQDVGLARFVDASVWSREEWFTNVLTAPPLVMKVLVIAGAGVEYGAGERLRRKRA